jgi:hypothetical protein
MIESNSIDKQAEEKYEIQKLETLFASAIDSINVVKTIKEINDRDNIKGDIAYGDAVNRRNVLLNEYYRQAYYVASKYKYKVSAMDRDKIEGFIQFLSDSRIRISPLSMLPKLIEHQNNLMEIITEYGFDPTILRSAPPTHASIEQQHKIMNPKKAESFTQ